MMKNKSTRDYEKEIRFAIRNLKDANLFSDYERKIFYIIKMSINYLQIYDKIESTNFEKLFYELFLNVKNDGRTLVALASDFGWCQRNLLRYKKKILKIYICIYEKIIG